VLKLLSRFVLEVLPYVLSAAIAAVVVPGFLSSQLHGSGAAATTSLAGSAMNTVELARRNHAAVQPTLSPKEAPRGTQRQLTAK
jgi:hypothetical protein